jgi:regulator of sigma D
LHSIVLWKRILQCLESASYFLDLHNALANAWLHGRQKVLLGFEYADSSGILSEVLIGTFVVSLPRRTVELRFVPQTCRGILGLLLEQERMHAHLGAGDRIATCAQAFKLMHHGRWKHGVQIHDVRNHLRVAEAELLEQLPNLGEQRARSPQILCSYLAMNDRENLVVDSMGVPGVKKVNNNTLKNSSVDEHTTALCHLLVLVFLPTVIHL